MAGVQGSDPVLMCIYTKKTLRWLYVAILKREREKERLHGNGEKRKERGERGRGKKRPLRASRDALRRESNDFGNPIPVTSQPRDLVAACTLRDNFVTAEMHQRRGVYEARDCKIGKAEPRERAFR